jgi:hypothetical protein
MTNANRQDNRTLENLQQEINLGISEALNDSKLMDFLESHNLVDPLTKTQFVIDTKKIKSNAKLDIDLLKDDSEEITTNERGDFICMVDGVYRLCCAHGRLLFLM